MPSIDWIGKAAVERHHLEIPYRLVHCNGRLSMGDVSSDNLLVQGDNLEALRALLPHYAGRVKCIYIDPPYNTDKTENDEKWVYNDRVNSREISDWLDKTVGTEAQDLCRHDKWLCMMYPRLCLLREFLRKDGVIFVSIDDNEQHRLRMLMDDVFGGNNFVNTIIWQRASGGGNAKGIITGHDHVLVYQKSKKPVLDFRGDEIGGRFSKDKIYKKDGKTFFIDDDVVRKVFGPYEAGTERRCHYEELVEYKNEREIAKIEAKIEQGEYMLVRQKSGKHFIARLIEEGERKKMYSIIQGVLNNDGMAEIKEMGLSCPYPKPTALIRRLLHSCCDKDSIIMDSFAGSGTTAHAVLQLNKEDGGNRQFILVEMDKEISETITVPRIQKTIEGYEYSDPKKGILKTYEPLGGGCRFCTLGAPLFDAEGNIDKTVKFSDLAAHIFFTETGKPIPKRAENALLGEDNGRAIYLLYNGIMGNKHKDGGNILTPKILTELPKPAVAETHRVIFAEGTTLSPASLSDKNIDFRQIPYKIHMR